MTSNIGFGYKVKSYKDHPVKHFYELGLPFSLSMDNWLLSGDTDHCPDPGMELVQLARITETWNSVKTSLINGAKAAFSPKIDDNWIHDFVAKIDKIFREFEVPNIS